MAKDPAFLFYPGDWLSGTMGMTFEEKGAYFELLMLQFNRGHMTTDMIGRNVGQLWVKVKDKFIQDKDGLWYNARLEEEQIKRKNFVSTRKNNLSGENQYSKKQAHKGGHTTSRMENENRNENEDEILIEYEHWGDLIVDGNDHQFEGDWMNHGIKITPEKFVELVKDHLALLSRYPKMRPPSQHAFRKSLIKHIKENKDKTNGKRNSAADKFAEASRIINESFGGTTG